MGASEAAGGIEAAAPPAGLTSAEAAARLERDGRNVLPAPTAMPAWRQLLAQVVSFFALMLWVAGALAFVAGMPQLGVAIFVVVGINAAFAFVQEHRAERAAQRLRDLLPRRARVIRDGQRLDIDASELVVGDLVALEGGDRVSADLDVLWARSLMLDTSTLTGEAVPVAVAEGDRAYAGTFVTEGEARAKVAATGARTRLAGIASLSQRAPRPSSPLTVQLRQVVRTIAIVAISVGVVFFGFMLLLGTPPSNGFIFAVGVTVALVPEGLLPTVTLSLAMAAQRMADRNALVRHIEAVETLGATTFICTDKTGTLTANQMTVVEVWTPSGSAQVEGTGYNPSGRVVAPDDRTASCVRGLALAGVRCSTGRAVERDGRWMALGTRWKRRSTCSRAVRARTWQRTRRPRRNALASRSTRGVGACRSSRATVCSSRAPLTRWSRSVATRRRPPPLQRTSPRGACGCSPSRLAACRTAWCLPHPRRGSGISACWASWGSRTRRARTSRPRWLTAGARASRWR